MGKNPIEKTITLINDKWSDCYLKLSPDGTAALTALYDEDYYAKELNYTYNAEKKAIYMQVEKSAFDFLVPCPPKLLTYNEIISQINKEYTVENTRKVLEKLFKEDNDSDYDSYEDYEKAFIEDEGFDSLKAYTEYQAKEDKAFCKAIFGAQVTYSYKIDGEKMTLTEEFTGVKNMLLSSCKIPSSSSDDEDRIIIYRCLVDIYDDKGVDWSCGGILDTDKKTIAFRSKNGEIFNGSYSEDISEKTVTIRFNGEDYVCKFEAVNFTRQ